MIDWLLVWYAVVFSGLLIVIHEPEEKKFVRINRVNAWLNDVIAYTYALDGYTDPLFDTKPSELDDAATYKAPSVGMVHR